ncbi:MAG: hypothetical protein JSW27_15860 [Phycisphaerales bacterium]|nr:MAG: hypothetical protein JSW27_15860 [Phycisphaerales bacterium]
MSKNIRTYLLLAFWCVSMLLAGCFPDDSLVWSSDGAFGLFRAQGKLFVVDGATGALTPVEPDGGVSLMPGISADGRHITYVKGVGCTDVDEGLQLFPPATRAMLRRDAEQLGQKVMAGLVLPSALVPGDDKTLEFSESYHRWVLQIMCQAPEAALAEKLGPDILEECRQCEIGYNRLMVAPRSDPHDSRALVTLPVTAMSCRFSPNGRYVAYVMPDRQDEEVGTLLVASVDGKVGMLEVAKGVALSFDWRPDGRALAYVKREGGDLFGVVEERIVADDTNALLMELASDSASAPVGVYRCSGESRHLAGTFFQPFMKVQYGPMGRLFFSSPAVKVPTSDLDEPTYSLFCYDSVTGTVVDVLPPSVSSLAGDMVNFFALAPDGTKVLLPMENYRFAIVTLGDKTPVLPIEEEEKFGDSMPQLLPAWKGSTQISCLVSERSRFLSDSTSDSDDRHEIVVLNVDGSFATHLSQDWPDDLIP